MALTIGGPVAAGETYIMGEGGCPQDAPPKLYEQRIRKLPPNTHRAEYWLLEEWAPCDCPDCDAEAHWMQRAGGSLEMVESMKRGA